MRPSRLSCFTTVNLDLLMSSTAHLRSRGVLVSIEGPDRVGKTTQVSLIADQRLASCFRFPNRLSPLTGPPLVKMLTRQVRSEPRTDHMLFTANRWEAVPDITRQLLDMKHDVVLDRYCHSGVAYSVARGVDEKWAWATQVGLPKPDLVIYLRLGVEQLKGRTGFGDEALETEAIQLAVVEQYDEWARRGAVVIIDAVQSVEQVQEQIRGAIELAKVRTQGSELGVYP